MSGSGFVAPFLKLCQVSPTVAWWPKISTGALTCVVVAAFATVVAILWSPRNAASFYGIAFAQSAPRARRAGGYLKSEWKAIARRDLPDDLDSARGRTPEVTPHALALVRSFERSKRIKLVTRHPDVRVYEAVR